MSRLLIILGGAVSLVVVGLGIGLACMVAKSAVAAVIHVAFGWSREVSMLSASGFLLLLCAFVAMTLLTRESA